MYVTFPAPWHLVDVPPNVNTGVPTSGVTVNEAGLEITWGQLPLVPLITTS